jgi:hypothetical protein
MKAALEEKQYGILQTLLVLILGGTEVVVVGPKQAPCQKTNQS